MEIRKTDLIDFNKFSKEECRILDMRDCQDFAQTHIPCSLNISLTPHFHELAELFLCPDQALILVLPEDKKEQCLQILNNAKFNNIKGYLTGGIHTWSENNSIDIVISLDAEAFHLDTKYGSMKILDVRTKKEYELMHHEAAINMDIKTLISEHDELDKSSNYCMYCTDGTRSMTLLSWLKIHSLHNIYHVKGGFEAIKDNGEIHFLASVKNTTDKRGKIS